MAGFHARFHAQEVRHYVKWHIGGLPIKEGWYIVVKFKISSPVLMKFDPKSHGSWGRVIAWDGPINIPMAEVKF